MKSYVSALILGISIIIAVLLLSNAYTYKFRTNQTVSVVGLAEVDFTSDLIVWEGRFTRKNFSLKDAYASLKNDENEIRNYLRSKGIPDSAMIFSSVDIMKEQVNSYDRNGNITGTVFNGYNLTQQVKIESMDIEKVEKLSREVTGLIEKGIELNSAPPMYFYTKLANLKMDLLAAASKDAKARAETIAKSAGSNLGNTRKATMGVFQITGKNKNENFSYGGSFNTMDKFKTASITVRIEYQLD
ncbi:MAG TPA: SIMPL domain-containing protein [Chitinophagaceae bacterium]|nr:SIMPL domain-containing protein [Chitinophagaceae bacterium]